jgi:hypothetical protein
MTPPIQPNTVAYEGSSQHGTNRERAVTVTHHLLCLLRSPSGWMLDSIDSPQGDQVDRTAAIRAIRHASASWVLIARAGSGREKGRRAPLLIPPIGHP